MMMKRMIKIATYILSSIFNYSSWCKSYILTVTLFKTFFDTVILSCTIIFSCCHRFLISIIFVYIFSSIFSS